MVHPGDTVAGAPPDDADATDDAGAEFARWLFAQPCRFFHAAARHDDLPPAGPPEVAFAGRSNCGKSSLLNTLTGRRALARTSNTPGRTQQLNFFDLAEKVWLVDMPGYGYARASKDHIAKWTQLLRDYLRGRATLRRLCLLIDSRHGIKANDEEMMALLDAAAVSYLVVLTKTDKLSPSALADRIDATARALREHPAALPAPIATSARTGDGVDALRIEIAKLAG